MTIETALSSQTTESCNLLQRIGETSDIDNFPIVSERFFIVIIHLLAILYSRPLVNIAP
jgi:hypothetical protein